MIDGPTEHAFFVIALQQRVPMFGLIYLLEPKGTLVAKSEDGPDA